jgi:hypothetical protein
MSEERPEKLTIEKTTIAQLLWEEARARRIPYVQHYDAHIDDTTWVVLEITDVEEVQVNRR